MKALQHLFDNPIRAFALLCVAASSVFLGYVNLKLIDLLSSPGWCGKAIQAERITPGQSFQGLTGCIDILKLQLGSLSKVLLINSGTFALCLGVLVVIVVAGARLAGKLLGGEIDVSREAAASKAANEVAGAAVGKATEITQGQSQPSASPIPSGPAMPPPPESPQK